LARRQIRVLLDDLIEMAEDDHSLAEFIATYSLPHVAKVTEGYCSDSNSDEYDFSTNDVIKVSFPQLPQVSEISVYV